MRRLGKAIAKGLDYDAELLNEFLNWNAELTFHGEVLLNQMLGRFFQQHSVQLASDYRFQEVPLLDVSGRAKHRDTLFQKLKRNPNGSLAKIRDISGLRVDCEFVRSDQFKLVHFLMAEFEEIGDTVQCKLIDRIADPRAGYRALHIEVECPAGNIEIQVRSNLQYQWANTFEHLGDTFGRELRYEDSQNPVLHELQQNMCKISDEFNSFEESIDQIVESARTIERAWFENQIFKEEEHRELLQKLLVESRDRIDGLMVQRYGLIQSMERIRRIKLDEEE